MEQAFKPFLDFLIGISNFIWNYILIYTLIPMGIYFSIRSRFAQIRLFPRAIKLICQKNGPDEVSSLQALLVSTGVRVGTGNIAGVAVAISIGGSGAVFWMWLTALFGMSLSLVENSLGQYYKVRHGDGYIGGPAFYLRDGLGGSFGKFLSFCFSVSIILCFGIGFNAIQANTVSDLLLSGSDAGPSWLVETFGSLERSQLILALCLTGVSFYAISGGLKRVASFSQIMVPFMSLFYLLLVLIIMVMNFDRIPEVFGNIFRSAFGYSAALGGFTGSMLRTTLMQGVQRGLFSNEAGLGSAPNIAATVETPHPVNQGIVQALGVFIDTILICSGTAFLLLFSDSVHSGELGGVILVENAMRQYFGTWGTTILAICVFFFAFSSLVGNYYCGESNVLYLSRSSGATWGFRLLVGLAVFLGATLDLASVWGLGDLFMGFMAVINLFGIAVLSEKGFKLIKDFERQKDVPLPVFHLSSIGDRPDPDDSARAGIWK